MERRDSVNAHKQDAYNACRNTSFEPEKRGEQLMNDLELDIQCILSKVPVETHKYVEEKLIEKTVSWWRTMSRCFSVMITGAGNFNSRRHQKTNDAEHKAMMELDEWKENIVRKMNRTERKTGWEEVERLSDRLQQEEKSHQMMIDANKILRNKKTSEVEKAEELEDMGFSKTQINELMNPEWGSPGFASYTLTNSNSRIKDLKRKIEIHQKMASKEDRETEYGWGKLIQCFSEERFRFVFNDRPSASIISMLKSNGFKWAPSIGAWQRQITPNAKYATKRVLDELNKAV